MSRSASLFRLVFEKQTPVVATAVLAISLTACSGGRPGKSPAVSAAEVASKYGYNETTTDLTPAYALVSEFGDPRDQYARLLLLKECIKDVETYQVLPPVADSSTTVFDPRSGDRRFTLEIAQGWGYQLPPVPATVSSTVLDENLSSSEIVKMEAKCGSKTSARLGPAPVQFLTGIVDAGWDALKADDDATKTAADWRSCMMPVGIVDLPQTPSEMPSPSVATQTGDGGAQPATPPSPRERQVAVADVMCRDSAGYTFAVKTARANGELTAIGKDVEGFEAARKAYEAYGVGIEKVIQTYG